MPVKKKLKSFSDQNARGIGETAPPRPTSEEFRLRHQPGFVGNILSDNSLSISGKNQPKMGYVFSSNWAEGDSIPLYRDPESCQVTLNMSAGSLPRIIFTPLLTLNLLLITVR